jgi:hypothetical protein
MHGSVLGHTFGVPKQKPEKHVSLSVQPLPSSQLASSLEEKSQTPDEQVPGHREGSPQLRSLTSVPTHAPLTQWSFLVHSFWSSHMVESGRLLPTHWPDWQVFSMQSVGSVSHDVSSTTLLWRQLPALHESSVQGFPSLQLFFKCWHPTGVQMSSVQGSPSSTHGSLVPTQTPFTQTSLIVHGFPSLQLTG